MRSRPKMRPAVATLVTGAVALAMALVATDPAAGIGSGVLKYVSKTKTVPNAEPGVTSQKADCPVDHPLATGGGMQITGNQSGLDLEIGSTLSETGLKGWTATANNSSSSSAQMKVFAICARTGITHRVGHKNVPANSQGQLKVSCPSGSKLTGGGVGIGGNSHKQEVATSRPFDGPDADHAPDDGWLGRANNGLTRTVTMTVEAVCARSGSFSYHHSSLKSVANNTQVSASVNCPQGSKVTGGGINITGTSLGIEVAGSFPFDGSDADHVPDNGWRAAANNDGSGGPQKMQTFAICKS